MPFLGDGGTLPLPGIRKLGQGRSYALDLVGRLVAQGLEDLAGDHRSEHVQHLVPLIAGGQKPHRGLPHLWRVVGPQLVGDDLMHGDVQDPIDRHPSDVDLALSIGQSLVQLRMLGLDE